MQHSKPLTHNSLGFVFSLQEMRLCRAAIRNSISFMQDFGKGSKPRFSGDRYIAEAAITDKALNRWLSEKIAALYCGVSIAALHDLVSAGEVRRRVFNSVGRHTYYEYCLADLDNFIAANNLA